MASKSKKILLWVLGFLGIVMLFILLAAWQTGIFSSPKISMEERAGFHYVYLERTGPYSEIAKAQEALKKAIKDQNIKTLIPCGLYLDNPANVKQNELRWRIGYTVKDSVQVAKPLKFETVPARLYVIASIKAHPAVAALKNYPAMKKWVVENQYVIIGPAMEFYLKDGTVESMFPVRK